MTNASTDIELDELPVENRIGILRQEIQMLTNTIFLIKVRALADKQLEVPGVQEKHKADIEESIKKIAFHRGLIAKLQEDPKAV